jgi:hypothetical protein
VAAQPGHTKDLQSIQLERGIRIVDSPGVVFDEDDEESSQFGGKARKKGSVLLRNVVRVEDVDDPIAVGTYRSALSLVLPLFSLYLILNLHTNLYLYVWRSRGNPCTHRPRNNPENIQPAPLQLYARISHRAGVNHWPASQGIFFLSLLILVFLSFSSV